VPAAIAEQSPDIAVLTEYVEGDDHPTFIGALAAAGLRHHRTSARTPGHNQILIASTEPLRLGGIEAPPLHAAVPSNALHVVVETTGVNVLGFRVPAFKGKDKAIKRSVWEWLIGACRSVETGLTVVTGDFNTAPGDRKTYCGDCLDVLPRSRWQRVDPADGFSWTNSKDGSGRRIDHTFLSPQLPRAQGRYVWTFREMSPEAASGRVGIPDHAMLVVDWRPLVSSL
jgi:exonuclease III